MAGASRVALLLAMFAAANIAAAHDRGSPLPPHHDDSHNTSLSSPASAAFSAHGRRLQFADIVEPTCDMNKFQQDLQFLDLQCCALGECQDGRPPSTCRSPPGVRQGARRSEVWRLRHHIPAHDGPGVQVV